MRSTKEEAEKREENAGENLVVYDAFVPIVYRQFADRECKEFDTFDDCVDEFFSKIESQKIELQQQSKQNTVSKRLDKVKLDQFKRIKSLEEKQQEYRRKAELIQNNLEDVEKAILIIRSAIANSIDWAELNRIVKEEKKNGDPIAQIIQQLHLEENKITLMLSDIPYDSDEELTSKPALVSVNISLSAHSNRQYYFDLKKNASDKLDKTQASVQKALKAAEKTAIREMKEVKVKSNMQKVRKQLWFEKFYWFLSSDNYIIISGREAMQNELIVKRYLQKGDLYVHADIHGASSCVIKNPTGNVVPPTTLEQAGTMAICRSAAWNAKVVTSAYWVYHNQVSKTAPTGEYLVQGSFMIRGKKNFLPPVQLVMGFAFLFRVEESCISKHAGERQPKLADYLDANPAQNIADKIETSDPSTNDENSSSVITSPAPQPAQEPQAPPSTTSDESPKTETGDENDVEVEIEENEEESSESGEATNENDSTNAEATPATESEANNEKEATPATEEAAAGEDKPGKAEKLKFQPAFLGIPEKYRIDSMDREEESDEDEEGKPGATKKRISKKDRKLMKKGVDPSQLPKTEPKSPAEKQEAKKGQRPPAKPATPVNKGPTRGQKSKIKKIKQKYADQDEEEREIRMKLLASAGKPAPEPIESAEPKSQRANAAPKQQNQPKNPPKKNNKQTTMTQEDIELKQQNEEALQNLALESMANTSILSELTGKPHADDVLVCFF